MAKQSSLEELMQSIKSAAATMFIADPFYAELTRFSEEHDVAIPTVNLQDAELRDLRDLIKRWTDGEPVAGVIEQDFGFDEPGESRS